MAFAIAIIYASNHSYLSWEAYIWGVASLRPSNKSGNYNPSSGEKYHKHIVSCLVCIWDFHVANTA
jgi:hypothetical protein